MGIQYLTDEHGEKTAVVIPLAEWEALLSEDPTPARLTEADAIERKAAYEELERGEALALAGALKA